MLSAAQHGAWHSTAQQLGWSSWVAIQQHTMGPFCTCCIQQLHDRQGSRVFDSKAADGSALRVVAGRHLSCSRGLHRPHQQRSLWLQADCFRLSCCACKQLPAPLRTSFLLNVLLLQVSDCEGTVAACDGNHILLRG